MTKTKGNIIRNQNQSAVSAPKLHDYSFLFDSPCDFLREPDSFRKETKENIFSSGNSDTVDTIQKSDRIISSLSEIPADTRMLNTMGVPLGSGKIVNRISSSGNSHIYKIWNEDLEMFRAVKICISADSMHNAMNRFFTEAKIAAQLRHPNIIEVYSLGKWNEIPYIEMEFIDGLSVGHIIKKNGPLPQSVSCAISIFTCKALLYANQHEFRIGGKVYRGVIHRDLKPHNIMISNSGIIKLLDFGIARPCDESLYQTVASDKIVGTIQYLSPEQMDGSELDFKTDIYSFGVVLYEMITGVTTFPQTTLSNIVKAKISNHYNSFKELNIDVPSGLEEIVTTCLEFKKENRFSGLQELLNALEEVFLKEYNSSYDEVVRTFIKNYLLQQML